MTAAGLLSRLDRVKPTGVGRWLACCPSHEDRSPSLSIRELDDARVLVHCFGGCAVADVLAAVGLTLCDLFPERLNDHRDKRERRPFLPSDVFTMALHEVAVVCVVAADMHKHIPITDIDHARLFEAWRRLNDISEKAYGR